MKFISFLLLYLFTSSALGLNSGTFFKTKNRCLQESYENTNITVLTLIKCAKLSITRRCQVFSLENGVCTVFPDASGAFRKASAYVQVSRNLTVEVARNKSVTWSSNYGPSVGTRIVDGDPNTWFHSADHFESDQPWLLVDLGMTVAVETFRILPYANEHASRFRDIQVLLGDTAPPNDGNFSDFFVAGTIDGPIAADTQWLDFDVSPPRCSRYAAVYKYIENQYEAYVLEVKEIEILTSFEQI